jgi:hypothetical protein
MAEYKTHTVAEKLEAIRLAAQYELPTADIDTMLSEIGSGYHMSECSPAPMIDPCKG